MTTSSRRTHQHEACPLSWGDGVVCRSTRGLSAVAASVKNPECCSIRIQRSAWSYHGCIVNPEIMGDLVKEGRYGASCGPGSRWRAGVPDVPIRQRTQLHPSETAAVCRLGTFTKQAPDPRVTLAAYCGKRRSDGYRDRCRSEFRPFMAAGHDPIKPSRLGSDSL